MLKYSEASFQLHMIKRQNGNKMTKEEAVALMCNTVDEFNRFNAAENNYPADQIEEFIAAGQEQMQYVNGMIYDVLRLHGVIA